MKFVIGCMLTLLLFTGCEKDINFDLEEAAPVLAVDAQIENDQAPVVILTKSFSYFDKLTPELLSGAFVRNAEVYISNGTLTTNASKLTPIVVFLHFMQARITGS